MGDFSKEFCAGTHVNNTGDLGSFHILSEESVGSGVRRITSVTKMKSYDSFKQEEETLNDLAALLKLKKADGLHERIAKLLEENNELKKEVAAANEKALQADAESKLAQAKEINGLHVLTVKLKNFDAGELKKYAELLRNKMQDGFVFVADETNGKVVFVAASSKAAIAKGLKAGDIVKKAAQICGGNGGGRPDMAQAGGRDVAKIDEAIAAVKQTIEQLS